MLQSVVIRDGAINRTALVNRDNLLDDNQYCTYRIVLEIQNNGMKHGQLRIRIKPVAGFSYISTTVGAQKPLEIL